jgi:hypothetical protein
MHVQVAVFFFHDPFTVLKGVGLVIIIFGVALFNWFKYVLTPHQKQHSLLEIYPLLIQIPDVFAVLVFSLFHFQFV